jgi:ankyrin repeat protein
MSPANRRLRQLAFVFTLFWSLQAPAQTPPSASDLAAYDELFSAVVKQDAALLVAAYFGNHQAMRKLVAAGADANALEQDYYDIVTIAAVANDLPTLRLALQLGCKPGNVTSRYDGTALIAAAHLGHVEVVQTLIDAGAPLDHVNNLNWTAVIESIVLGDGGKRHVATLKALVDAGANVNLPDAAGRTPLRLARDYGFDEMIEILQAAGAR